MSFTVHSLLPFIYFSEFVVRLIETIIFCIEHSTYVVVFSMMRSAIKEEMKAGSRA